jgi:hypothetical protein
MANVFTSFGIATGFAAASILAVVGSAPAAVPLALVTPEPGKVGRGAEFEHLGAPGHA